MSETWTIQQLKAHTKKTSGTKSAYKDSVCVRVSEIKKVEGKIKIKPLSVNVAWKGRRFKTKEYQDYEKAVLLMLPKFKIPSGRLEICLTYGFSNKAADFDNPTKPFIDILQKKYGFDDRVIYRAIIVKEIVDKGSEFISFSFTCI